MNETSHAEKRKKNHNFLHLCQFGLAVSCRFYTILFNINSDIIGENIIVARTDKVYKQWQKITEQNPGGSNLKIKAYKFDGRNFVKRNGERDQNC